MHTPMVSSGSPSLHVPCRSRSCTLLTEERGQFASFPASPVLGEEEAHRRPPSGASFGENEGRHARNAADAVRKIARFMEMIIERAEKREKKKGG